MARIEPKDPAAYPWYIRWILRRQQRRYGAALTPSLLWGRLPRGFLAMLGMLHAFGRHYPISAQLRSLVSIRIAQLNGCLFCVDLNAYNYLNAAGSADKAEAVQRWRDNGLFDDRERAALAYAEQVTVACAKVDDAGIQRLRGHFSDDQITALTAWIGFQNMSAKFNAALGAEQHGFCELPGGSDASTTGRAPPARPG